MGHDKDHSHSHMHSHGHSHSHNHSLLGKKLWLAIVLNLIVTIAQTVAGFWAGSLSLLSDALHNFSDVIALVLSYLAVRFLSRKSSLAQTFGFKRAEIIAAFVNTAGLLVIAALLCKEAITRLTEPAVTVDAMPVIALGGLGIIINFLSVLLIKKEAANSLNVRSAYLHLFSDIMSSIAVVIGGLAMYFAKIYWVDSVLTILIAIYLLYSSWDILMDSLRIIMHFTPSHIDLKDLEKAITAHTEIENVHHVHIWNLNDNEVHFEGHVDFKKDLPLSSVSRVIDEISHTLRDKFGIRHTVLQPEIGVKDSKQFIVSECNTKE